MNYRTERYPVVTLSRIGVNTLIWPAGLPARKLFQGVAAAALNC
ncbi:MAG: hypothetical protein P4N60_05960 [Verrucomicrobiae bacterium]|nr:hypothetical protein [Verrucomicrobiae bacterium]